MQQLGGIDNLMIEGEIPNIPMHIAAAMLYDSGAAEAELLEHLQHTLPDIISNHLPILRCRIEEMPLHVPSVGRALNWHGQP